MKPGLGKPGIKPGAKISGRATAMFAPPGLSKLTKLVAFLLILGGALSIGLAVIAKGPPPAKADAAAPTTDTKAPDAPATDDKKPDEKAAEAKPDDAKPDDAKKDDAKKDDAKKDDAKKSAGPEGAPPKMTERLLAGVPGALGVITGFMILMRISLGRILGMLLGLVLAGGSGYAAWQGFSARDSFVEKLHKNFPALTHTVGSKWPDKVPTGAFFAAPAALGLLLLLQMLASKRCFTKAPVPMSEAARAALKQKAKPPPPPEEDEEPPPEEGEGEGEGEGAEEPYEEEAPPEEEEQA